MNYFLLPTLFFSLMIHSIGFGQDKIVTTDGKEINAKVLKINKKDVLYKVYDDPEFTTYTLLEKEINTITTEKGKKYLFNHKYPRAFISLNIDGYQPIGSFGRTDFEKKEPGFAMVGLGGNIQFGFYITKRLGLNIRAGASGNRLNTDAIKDLYADPSDSLEYLYVNYDRQTKTQNYENWEFKHVMLGPMYSFKLATWLTVDTKVQFGFMSVRRPSVRIYAIDSSSIQAIGSFPKYSIEAERSSEKTMPAYGGGIAFRISPRRRIGFVISADYMHTGGSIHFQESIYAYNSSQPYNTPSYQDVERTYNIDQIKLSVGIAYQFKRKNR